MIRLLLALQAFTLPSDPSEVPGLFAYYVCAAGKVDEGSSDEPPAVEIERSLSACRSLRAQAAEEFFALAMKQERVRVFTRGMSPEKDRHHSDEAFDLSVRKQLLENVMRRDQSEEVANAANQ